MLIGLIGAETSVAAKVLGEVGVTLENAQTELEKMIGRGSGGQNPNLFTPRAQRVLELAREVAYPPSSLEIRTEHLLLGLIQEGGSIGVRVLKGLGVNTKQLQTQILQRLRE